MYIYVIKDNQLLDQIFLNNHTAKEISSVVQSLFEKEGDHLQIVISKQQVGQFSFKVFRRKE